MRITAIYQVCEEKEVEAILSMNGFTQSQCLTYTPVLWAMLEFNICLEIVLKTSAQYDLILRKI